MSETYQQHFDEQYSTVEYHNIDVYERKCGIIRLTSGGLPLKHIRIRINDALRNDQQPYRVISRDGTWYIIDHENGEIQLFEDGIMIPEGGL